MEGRVPRAGGSKQTAHGTKKLHDFHERNTTRARKQKRAERETAFIRNPSASLLLSHLGRLLTLPTIAAATARGRDQVGRAGPIPSPLQPR